MNKSYLPHLLLTATTLVAALNYSISKILMPQFMQPSGIILLRSIAAVVFFFSLYFLTSSERIAKADFPRLILASGLGISANQLLFIEGLNLTTPINASLMMTSSPVIVFLVSVFLLKEKITWTKVIGIAMAASGTISLLLHSSVIKAHNILFGDILVLSNACCWAFFLVLIKPLMLKYKATTIVPFLFLFGCIFTFPFGYNDLKAVQFSTFTTEAWMALVFVVFFSTFFAYYFNIHVMKYVNPSIAGAYIYLQPMLASGFSILLGKDHLTLEKIIFSILILSGVYLVSFKNKVSQETSRLSAK